MRPQDIFGTASPKTVLNKPFMHVQDQKAYNVDGGTSIADAWTKRDLNTVIANDIQGATLSGNAVNLPAGTYYVEGEALGVTVGADSQLIGIFKDGVRTPLQSKSYSGATGITYDSKVSGVVTLAVPGTIDLRYYFGIGNATIGLGKSNNSGSITDPSIPSIYADLKIWQLDRSLEIAPKAINSGLQTVPGLDTTGAIMGFDIRRTGANQLTVSKGSCLDSTLLVPMALTADTTVAIPAVANTFYHLFIVRLVADGTFTVKAYATEAAVASDNTVNAWRWLGFWRTNGSGNCVVGIQVGEYLMFGQRGENVLWNINGMISYAIKDHSTFIPVTRISEILYGMCDSGGSQGFGMTSLDGSNVEAVIGQGVASGENEVDSWGSMAYKAELFLPFTNSRYFRMSANNGLVILHAVKVRR